MNDLRGKSQAWGLGLLALWSGPPRVPPPEAGSIREEETALCLDCHVIFSIRNRSCPKCDGEQFWLIANWKKGASPKTTPPRRAVLASA